LCSVSCPQPVASAWSQPCLSSCGDSRALIQPPPVLVTFPGPILSSCPQESFVGSSCPEGAAASFGPGGAQSSREPGASLGGCNSS
ncbi:KRSC protein, partial [Dasyornis broadbenti]|nr:KRSC protein [Dasyornis broadbenti]